MEVWEHNLRLDGESSEEGPNLVFEGESSETGPNVILGLIPIPVGRFRRFIPQAEFPTNLLEGRVSRLWPPTEVFVWIGSARHRFLGDEAIPPSTYLGRVSRRNKGRIIAWTKIFRQHYRVADDSLDRYELYLEEDQLPDFDGSGQPVATSATLPITHTPTLPESPNTTEWWAVVRKRNKFGLLSFNLHPTIIEIDSGGDEEEGPLTDPEITRVVDGETGQIIVFGRYPHGVDRNEADTWELYAVIGSTPDPAVDPMLDTGTFGPPAGDYLWKAVGDGLTPGATYQCLLVVRRGDESGIGVEGESLPIAHTLAEVFDIDSENAWVFGGQDHEIGT